MKDYIAKAEIDIKADPSKVWNALTDPEIIKQYLFGTNVTSEWKAGSPIQYSGTWEGKKYTDKGTILKVEKEKLLQSTFFSSLSGKEDIPENYAVVTYMLSPLNGGTRLSVTQDNNPTEESKNHSEGNWRMVLKTLKNILEQQKDNS